MLTYNKKTLGNINQAFFVAKNHIYVLTLIIFKYKIEIWIREF